jgi:hypothetical protein
MAIICRFEEFLGDYGFCITLELACKEVGKASLGGVEELGELGGEMAVPVPVSVIIVVVVVVVGGGASCPSTTSAPKEWHTRNSS